MVCRLCRCVCIRLQCHILGRACTGMKALKVYLTVMLCMKDLFDEHERLSFKKRVPGLDLGLPYLKQNQMC